MGGTARTSSASIASWQRSANFSAVSSFRCAIDFRPPVHGPGSFIGVPRGGRVSGLPYTMIVAGAVEATSGQSLGSSSTCVERVSVSDLIIRRG